ncbi:MAG: hypothetical protein ABEL04_12140 [Salinibacter sp.]|uniref:hypothetical protein n=1 Tax=Salinibacter sp. TaxID=2065818 RepID=UPI0035D437B7
MRTARTVSGRADVTREGALLLRRPDTAQSSLATGEFVPRARWTLGWFDISSAAGRRGSSSGNTGQRPPGTFRG